MKVVYIISGPAGVGKSTVSKRLVRRLERSSYISGDAISHIPVNGRGKPWLCQDTLNLTWMNILCLTKNLLDSNFNVVIDYVTFPTEADWLVRQLDGLGVRVVYVVLMVSRDTLLVRDQSRDPGEQMGQRSLILLDEFESSLIDDRYKLNTEQYKVEEIDEIINQIMTNKKFMIS